MTAPRVLLESVEVAQWDPGGALHGLAQATRAELGLPLFTARHHALAIGARGFLARDEAGRDVAAYRVAADGTLFEMDALLATDTERLCMSFRALLATGVVTGLLFRSDDSLLLPLALHRRLPTPAMVTHRTLLGPGVPPLLGPIRDDLARYVELGCADAPALAQAAAAAMAEGRIPLVELPEAEVEVARELVIRGFRELHFVLRLSRSQVVDSAPTKPRDAFSVEALLAEDRRQQEARRQR